MKSKETDKQTISQSDKCIDNRQTNKQAENGQTEKYEEFLKHIIKTIL